MFKFYWLMGMLMPLFAAEGSGASSIQNALTTGFTTVANDALSAIGAILPIALPVLGAIVVIMVGIRIFKRVAK